MKKNFEIIDHGWDHEQYFPGCGTAFSDFTFAATGCADNQKDAYEDAVEQIYQRHMGKDADILHLPTRPRGFNKKNHVPAKLARQGEHWWYVSIRYNL